MPKFYTTDDAATELGVKPGTIMWHIQQKKLARTSEGITAESINALRRTNDSDLDLWVAINEWFKTADLPVSDHTRQQMVVVLKFRTGPGGHRAARRAGKKLGVSRQRAWQVLGIVRRLYEQSQP